MGMRAAFALRIFSGRIILYFAFVALCGARQTLFSREGVVKRQTAFAAPAAMAAKFPAQLKGVPLGELANAVSLRG